MADKDNIKKDEEKIAKLVDRLNAEAFKELGSRPYFLVVATVHELERKDDKSMLGASWNWRSNIDSKEEGRSKESIENGKKIAGFLIDQLKDIADRPDVGLKARYKIK